jgi:hypothetical protein
MKGRLAKAKVNTVRDRVEGAAGEISSKEYYAINEANAHGLPV